MTKKEIYRKAIDKWGVGVQQLKLIEELSELIQQMSWVISQDNATQQDLDFLREEIADCEIMLEQMKMLYGEEKVQIHKQYKIERLKRRL